MTAPVLTMQMHPTATRGMGIFALFFLASLRKKVTGPTAMQLEPKLSVHRLLVGALSRSLCLLVASPTQRVSRKKLF
jgi:hypothetical protein